MWSWWSYPQMWIRHWLLCKLSINPNLRSSSLWTLLQWNPSQGPRTSRNPYTWPSRRHPTFSKSRFKKRWKIKKLEMAQQFKKLLAPRTKKGKAQRQPSKKPKYHQCGKARLTKMQSKGDNKLAGCRNCGSKLATYVKNVNPRKKGALDAQSMGILLLKGSSLQLKKQ